MMSMPCGNDGDDADCNHDNNAGAGDEKAQNYIDCCDGDDAGAAFSKSLANDPAPALSCSGCSKVDRAATTRLCTSV